MRRTPVLVLLAALTLAACGGNDKAPSGGTSGGALATALGLAPGGDVALFEFSDVKAIRAVTGKDLAKLGTFYAERPSKFLPLEQMDWASEVSPAKGAPLHAIGVSDAFDYDKVAAKLDGCGYAKREVGDDVVYSAPLSVVTKCAGPFGDGVPIQPQIALAKSRHALLLGADPDAIDGALKGEGTLGGDDTVRALLARLADRQAVALAPTAGFCTKLSQAVGGRAPSPAAVEEAKRRNPAGAPYAGFAIGMRFAAGGATGRIVLHYGDEAAASKDVKVREDGLRNGTSVATNRPFSEILKLDAAKAEGNDVLLDVSPGAGGRLPLYDMLLRYDLAFARC
jgi:hypothetical protein